MKAMNKYKVVYTETIVHEFFVEADSIEEAMENFEYMGQEGQLDFSDGEIVDTEREIFDEENDKYVNF